MIPSCEKRNIQSLAAINISDRPWSVKKMAMPIDRYDGAPATGVSQLATNFPATHKSEHSPDLPSHRARLYEASSMAR
jgi:hypothetical protein